MSETAYFVQECPTCGRRLHIRVEYLGRTVCCNHCKGKLVASDRPQEPAPSDSGIGLIMRADELLELAEQRKARPR